MKVYLLLIVSFAFLILGTVFGHKEGKEMMVSIINIDAEVEFDDTHEPEIESMAESVLPDTSNIPILNRIGSGRGRWAYYWREFSREEEAQYQNLKRPPGPPYVGIQVGHWKNTETPEELQGLRRNGNGAVGGGKTEVDTVLIIARQVKALLEAEGVVVDLLPATIPVDYVADAFVSIHADGNPKASVSGFKVASPQRDFSGRSVSLVGNLYESYGKETGLSRDYNITRRMVGYYAFNWRRYDHAVHPMTPSAIVETGFMTSPEDRRIIVSDPKRASKGIANGILNFLSLN